MADEKQNAGSCCDKNSPSCGCSQSPLRWVWLVILAAVVIFVVTRSGDKQNAPEGVVSEEPRPGIVWQDDYQKAMLQAKQENKPVLLAFHASWCPPCKEMKKTTYLDPGVVKVSESFVRIMVDVDQQKELAAKYQVNSIPVYKILNPDGMVKVEFGGYMSAQEYTKKLQEAL